MATGNDIPDPAKTSAMAQESLRQTMVNLGEHIDALTKPTLVLALSAEKRAQEGSEAVEPSSLLDKYVSWAKTPTGMHVPGELNEDRSDAGTPPKAPSGGAWEKFLGMGGQGAGPPLTPEAMREGIVGSAASIAGEDIKIPQFGDWRIDSLLKLGAQGAGKVAIGQYKSQAKASLEAGEEPIGPEEWASQQGGPLPSWGGLSNTLAMGAHVAATASLLHKRVLAPVADTVFQGATMGASLGYSPQAGEGALEQSHIMGIPNPIAQFLSPAGKAGLGTAWNAAQASFGGTGIGFGEAAGLREALGAQGWRNTRGGGFLNLTEGGAQENLARALEPMMKQGVKNPEVLSEFTDAVRLGTSTVQELTESLGGSKGLSETSQHLNKTVEATAVALQEFAAKTVEGGSTMVHGFRSGREISALTGMNPNLISGINTSNFGRVQALEKGILPWQIAGMEGQSAAQNAAETVTKLGKFIPKDLKPIERTNQFGEKEVVESVEAQELGWIHQLDPNVTAEEAKRLKAMGSHIQPAGEGMHRAEVEEQSRRAMMAKNEGESLSSPHFEAARVALQHAQQRLTEIQKGPHKGEIIEAEASEAVSKYQSEVSKYRGAVDKARALTPAQQASLNSQYLGGPKGLFELAKEAGVSKDGTHASPRYSRLRTLALPDRSRNQDGNRKRERGEGRKVERRKCENRTHRSSQDVLQAQVPEGGQGHRTERRRSTRPPTSLPIRTRPHSPPLRPLPSARLNRRTVKNRRVGNECYRASLPARTRPWWPATHRRNWDG